jgi:hypothetical protein
MICSKFPVNSFFANCQLSFVLCVYSFVLAAATSTFFLNYVHMILTVKARKQSKIAYPNAYASDELAKKDPAAFAFNCGTSPCSSASDPYLRRECVGR